MNKTIIAVIIVAVIALGGYFLLKDSGYQAPNSNLPSQSSSEQTPPTPSTTQETPATGQNQVAPTEPTTPTATTKPETQTPKSQSFTVNGNDSSADLTTITVPKGTPVTITFGADAQGTYHGGLDFRSSIVNSGTIAPGSTKIVTFTASQSFSFTPYWPSTNIAKPYKINIVVQ